MTSSRSFAVLPKVETLILSEDTARTYSQVQSHLREAGTPIPTNDIWIAASAMEHGLVVVTTDSHFQKVPQVRLELLEI